ncbi:MAG: hypothetical protein FWF41_03645, partial [Betaproteobacteria bacterium]|nr:hypothetical protein [Betaproteobacteria bacterium]
MNLLFRYSHASLLAATFALFAPMAFSADAMRVEGAPVTSTKAEAVVTWRAAPNVSNATAVTFMPLPATTLKAVQEENSESSGKTLQTKRLKIGV